MTDSSSDLRSIIIREIEKNPTVSREEIRQAAGLNEEKPDRDRLNKMLSRLRQAGDILDGFYFGEAWMRDHTRYHLLVATRCPSGDESPESKKHQDLNEPWDFQREFCVTVREYLANRETYRGKIVLGETVILTGGGEWDIQLTFFVSNDAHEVFRQFIRQYLRRIPTVLRTNTVAVSLIT